MRERYEQIHEFVAFRAKPRRDLPAALAGLSLPWSQGQTQGQITKFKTIEGGMYGRANFDLLTQRILSTAAAQIAPTSILRCSL